MNTPGPSEQLVLQLGTLAHPEHDPDATIQERFEQFHALNGWVFAALEQITEDYLAAGHRRVGIRMLWEVLRWQYNRVTTDPSSTFKVNDHYHSRYVRMLIGRHPEWAAVFETRVLRAA